MSTALAVISDRGDLYLGQCLEAAKANLPEFDFTVLVDDSGNGIFHPDFDDTIAHPQRRGLAAAVNSAWTAATEAGVDYLFHLEEDMVLTKPVPLSRLAHVLNRVPGLAQIALKRQFSRAEEAWVGHSNDISGPDFTERFISGGGFVTFCEPCHPDHVFTLNPCLIPRWIFEQGWPEGNEEGMTARCVEQNLMLAYWGRKTDEPRCAHIGEQRSAGWAL